MFSRSYSVVYSSGGEARANNRRESDESFQVFHSTILKAYDTQTDLLLSSDAFKPTLIFTFKYYFSHGCCCCQTEGFHHSHYLVPLTAPGPLRRQSFAVY